MHPRMKSAHMYHLPIVYLHVEFTGPTMAKELKTPCLVALQGTIMVDDAVTACFKRG